MKQRILLGRGALLALAALFIGLTVLSTWLLRGFRVDLTGNRLYTIAPGTQNIVRGLAEPVNLYYYWSAKTAGEYPALKTYGTQVREFLEELATRSKGKLRLSVIDPEPFSEDEDLAAERGVRGVPIGADGETFYFGLAGTNSTDGHEAIPFFDPSKEQFLEYDVAKLIQQLGRAQKPVVGWLSSLPMGGGYDPASGQPREPWYVYAQAEQLFTVRELTPAITKIDPDVDVLVLVHPKSLPQAAQEAIDQFALRGGHLLVFVDPLAEQDPGAGSPDTPYAMAAVDKSSQLATLLSAWGVQFDPKDVVGDLHYGMTVAMRAGEPPTRHIGILGLDAESLDAGDVVANGLGNINIATAGHLDPVKGATTTFTPLLQSSTDAGLLPVGRFAMLLDPGTLQDGFKPTGQRYVFAARVTGNVKTAFPQGPGPLRESAKPLNLIVFADTDLLADYLWLRDAPASFFGPRAKQAWAHNGDLVWNALDNLAGSNDLISVRGRASFTRPFERVEALRRDAEGRLRSKEQELEQQLSATEEKLSALQSQRADQSGLILTPEQTQEIERFEAQKLRIRKELRDVRLGLDQDIRRLGNELKILNIVVVPAVFALLALAVAVWRRKRQAAIQLVQRTGRS
ncbi:MAG: Gldg family protein [Steroidobacteraceae bacterium]